MKSHSAHMDAKRYNEIAHTQHALIDGIPDPADDGTVPRYRLRYEALADRGMKVRFVTESVTHKNELARWALEMRTHGIGKRNLGAVWAAMEVQHPGKDWETLTSMDWDQVNIQPAQGD